MEDLIDNVSVILRCRNEERWIGHTIQSCLDHINHPEIIVIDNKSSDESIKIAKNFAHDPLITSNKKYTKMKFLDINDYTPGKAINLGVKNAKHELILIISSHCILRSFNLENIEKQLNQHSCIFGNQNPYYFGKRISKRYVWANFTSKKIINPYSEDEARYFMHNALSCFKKRTLEENPFDEFLQGKEDRYWAQDIINNGKTILYDPDLSCDHHYTSNGNTWKGIG